MRLAFAGTPEFASYILQHLVRSRHNVKMVLTQPDRKAGRGQKLSASAVKTRALEYAIPLIQPLYLNEAIYKQLEDLHLDAIIVAAYGLLLPQRYLSLGKYGCINVHASILPRWRGAAPIQRAILAGDRYSGISIMQMDKGMDTGAVFKHRRCEISAQDTAQTLHDKLVELAKPTLLEVLDQLPQGLIARSQDNNTATLAPKINKLEALIDWHQTAQQIDRQIRAFNPWPAAYTYLYMANDKPLRVKILAAEILPEPVEPENIMLGNNKSPGRILVSNEGSLLAVCGDELIHIKQLQVAGKVIMSSDQFLVGHDVSDQAYFSSQIG